jgi:hypothetical protein
MNHEKMPRSRAWRDRKSGVNGELPIGVNQIFLRALRASVFSVLKELWT